VRPTPSPPPLLSTRYHLVGDPLRLEDMHEGPKLPDKEMLALTSHPRKTIFPHIMSPAISVLIPGEFFCQTACLYPVKISRNYFALLSKFILMSSLSRDKYWYMSAWTTRLCLFWPQPVAHVALAARALRISPAV
jgi:hypothetical protein